MPADVEAALVDSTDVFDDAPYYGADGPPRQEGEWHDKYPKSQHGHGREYEVRERHASNQHEHDQLFGQAAVERDRNEQ